MSKVRLGLLAYATKTGLGYQTQSLYRHLKPAKTMLVDLSQYNHMPVHDDWYNFNIRTNGFPSNAEVDRFLDGLDVVLVCETPLNYYLFKRARELGVKTVLQYNFEFLDYMNNVNLPAPDVFAAPTSWCLNDVRGRVLSEYQRYHPVTVTEVPVPVDLAELPKRTITQARRFFHVVGRPAVYDRNGTLDFIAAARLAVPRMPEAEFIIYCQQPGPDIERAVRGTQVQLVGHLEDQADMYREGDVLVLPRRYGGLCLPAQEAVGCGIPVLMPNVSPNNAWLPHPWLTPVKPNQQQFMARCPINVHGVNVSALADQMVDLYQHDDLVQRRHAEAKEIAQRMSWEALKPRYDEALGL